MQAVAEAGIRRRGPEPEHQGPAAAAVREPRARRAAAAAAAGACAGSLRLQRPVWKTLGKNKIEGKYT